MPIRFREIPGVLHAMLYYENKDVQQKDFWTRSLRGCAQHKLDKHAMPNVRYNIV